MVFDEIIRVCILVKLLKRGNHSVDMLVPKEVALDKQLHSQQCAIVLYYMLRMVELS